VSLIDVLPGLQSLSRGDKIRIIQYLARELERDEESPIEPGQSYPIWSPDQAYSAAEVLLKELENDKGQK